MPARSCPPSVQPASHSGPVKITPGKLYYLASDNGTPSRHALKVASPLSLRSLFRRLH
ncbi:hypothetical protein JMJ77_0001270, partial [Colletotrichum scovillei]